MLGSQFKFAGTAIVLSLMAAQGLQRVKPGAPSAPAPAAAQAAPIRASLPVRQDEIRISADTLGQFQTDVEVNGARIPRMLIDTGATLIALSYEDAAAAGIFPAPADYKYQVTTANGVAHVAKVRLMDVRIGRIVVHGVDAVVGERGALSGSLLGMTFLSRLSKFSVESGALLLRQ